MKWKLNFRGIVGYLLNTWKVKMIDQKRNHQKKGIDTKEALDDDVGGLSASGCGLGKVVVSENSMPFVEIGTVILFVLSGGKKELKRRVRDGFLDERVTA